MFGRFKKNQQNGLEELMYATYGKTSNNRFAWLKP